ncbi:MAG: hypothetical protein AAF943_18175 [Pseudomonadota bacterium]
MGEQAKNIVQRRRVFFIPGFDPFPPRRYRELYRCESQRQAAISGFDISVSGADVENGFGWKVEAQIDGAEVCTDVEVLVWSDLVRDRMQASVWATYGLMVRTLWLYLSTGAFLRLAKLRKGPVVAALYPVVILLGQALLALLVAVGANWLFDAIFVAALGPVLGQPISLALSLGLAALLLRWFRHLDRRLYVYYLMQDYAFSASHRGADPPALAARVEIFGQRIATALDAGADEVLIIGHSTGAQLAVSALARVLRKQVPHPSLALLTLGQVVPMVSFLPEAKGLRADLYDLAQSDDVFWVDVSAPGDGCAFALCDPVKVSGVAPPDQKGPLVLSAAFSQTLSTAQQSAQKWRFLRRHFQYMCAFERPGDYDYFQITAGPKTLRDRYGCRAPSPSRVETPLNIYTDRAA